MTKKWHKGPPPSIGWWPASHMRDARTLRWWCGQKWSLGACQSWTAKQAALQASLPSVCQADIMWTNRPKSWPERSKT